MSSPSHIQDTAPPPRADAPVRRCLATGQRQPASEMIRFALSPGGDVTPDLKATLPGRGMWLSADRESIKRACARRLFARAACRAVTVADDLPDQVETLLTARCVGWLSRAWRARRAVAGWEKVRATLGDAHSGGVLLAASDGATDGRRRMAALAHGMPCVTVLRGDELGSAFGRDFCVHACVTSPRLADALMRDARRLAGFRADSGEFEQDRPTG